jgi:nitroreductase/CTP:molybdopterin cytidylyltransferase MocA
VGERLGADKALLDLGGRPAIVRLCEQCALAGVADVVVVRRSGAAALPALPAGVRTVEVDGRGEMKDSLLAALAALPAATDVVVVLPVDHALVTADTIAGVAAAAMQPGTGIALPLFRDKPGHPVALRCSVFAELRQSQVTSLRDVVRADAARVRALPSANPWVLADLDRPEDLRAARAALAAGPHCVIEQMFQHRTRRAFAPTPLADGQLERLVDAARHASTSSYIQAYAVVAVTDPERKAAAAKLCADQRHIHQAPVFLAVCADLHKLAVACSRNGETLQAQSFELFLQATIDAALLGQNLQLAAESEGLGACMIGAARNHPLELAALLALPPMAFVAFGLVLGHAVDDPVPRGRMPLSGILHQQTYDVAAAEAALDGADAVMRQWAKLTNAPGRQAPGQQRRGLPVDETKGWADRMARLWGTQSSYVQARATLVAELRRLGFGLE